MVAVQLKSAAPRPHHFSFVSITAGSCAPYANSALQRSMDFIMPNRDNSTFKPKKRAKEHRGSDLCRNGTETLGSGNLRQAVKLPDGEDQNEWIAVNIVDFFNQISMLYGTITEFCTPDKCAVMSAGPKYEYYWQDSSSRRPVKCTAPQYIDYLMGWVQDQLEDDNVFPSKIGVAFSAEFMDVARTIMKRLFRIYAHVYYQHFGDIERLKEEAHLNTSFKHFMLFVNEFDMIEQRELAPLQQLIDRLLSKDSKVTSSSHTASSSAL